MVNYIKSEWYRITHTKDIYLMTGIMSLLVICMNVFLFVTKTKFDNFPYGTVSFSLNMLISNMRGLLIAGAMVVAILFSGEKRNGTLKNTISYGIPRESIFFGKSIICCTAALFSMIIILVAYIGSATLLLDGPVELPVQVLLKGVGAVLLSAFASVILAVSLFQFFEKDIIANVWWFAFIGFIPQIFLYAGIKIDFLLKIAEWMPWNYLKYEVKANMSGYLCLWDTPEGLTKCILSGIAGIIIFSILGLVLSRKKEV